MTRKPLPHPPRVPADHDAWRHAGADPEVQPRLAFGPFTLVMADRYRWALPGGGRETFGDLAWRARQLGWRPPTLYHVALTRRPVSA